MQQLFSTSGLRCTRQRLAIYDALRMTKSHPTADDLFQMVKGSGLSEGMSLATVYNTLEAFCRVGLAQRLPGTGDNGSSRYDATHEDHVHVRCEQTGTVADVPEELSEQILHRIPKTVLRRLEQEMGFKIEHIQIELVGSFAARRADRIDPSLS